MDGSKSLPRFITGSISSYWYWRPIGNKGLFHSLFHMILTLSGLAPPHDVTNGPPVPIRAYVIHVSYNMR